MKKMSIDDKLGLDLFHTDEEESHIQVDLGCTDEAEIKKLRFSHLGCLECGTCRVLSHGRIVKEWRHPQSGVGVTFRQG